MAFIKLGTKGNRQQISIEWYSQWKRNDWFLLLLKSGLIVNVSASHVLLAFFNNALSGYNTSKQQHAFFFAYILIYCCQRLM